jgi:tetratricopeptide (TPR) repeat protein
MTGLAPLRRAALVALAALGLGTGMALAGDPEPDDMDVEGVAGQSLPDITVPDSGPMPPPQRAIPADGRYPQVVLYGARVLDLEPTYVAETRAGFEMVFRREYKEARQHFVKLDQRYPGTGISGSVDALVWQALMLENFDFRYDRQYQVANKKALDDLADALKDPRHQAWEHFQMAGLQGVEAIHMVRKGNYLPALNLAFTAMDHIQAAREASPGFTDLDIADGMYNYWRTVVSMSSKMLPDFGDQRPLGIRQMQNVQQNGIFLSDPATLALAFSWLEERDFKRALAACAHGRQKYPDNVINNLLTGQTLIYLRRYEDAHAVFAEILQDAPENNRVHYYIGLAHLRKGSLNAAQAALQRYLGSDHLEDWQLGSTWYRMGQVHYRKKNYPMAYESYSQAVKANGHRPSKRAMDRMKRARKDGRIQF